MQRLLLPVAVTSLHSCKTSNHLSTPPLLLAHFMCYVMNPCSILTLSMSYQLVAGKVNPIYLEHNATAMY